MFARNHAVCWHVRKYTVLENLTLYSLSWLWILCGIPNLEVSLNKQKQLSWVLSHGHILLVPAYCDSNASVKLCCFVTEHTTWKQLDGCWAIIVTTESCYVALLEIVHTNRLYSNRLLLLSLRVNPNFSSTLAFLPSPKLFYLQTLMMWPIMPFLCCFQVLKLVESYRLLLLCV